MFEELVVASDGGVVRFGGGGVELCLPADLPPGPYVLTFTDATPGLEGAGARVGNVARLAPITVALVVSPAAEA